MPLRNPQDLINRPCLFKIKNYDKVAGQAIVGIKKVKKTVPKVDNLGNVIYKTIKVPETKGCGCKGGGKVPTGRMIEQKVPEVIEIWVDENSSSSGTMTLCKLFGTVHCGHCLNCKTYKASK